MYFPLSYVIATWQAYRQYGVLPKIGGYNDQDEQLMADWGVISRRYHWASVRGDNAIDISLDSGNQAYEQW